ncbi:ketoacyl-ACP synthase III [Limnospira fusiformis KN01]|uniref:ketoacyl-ACP synthase III n=1 Tax=Limnospira TaxID=2596745 RepID=UPI001658AE0D|nr:MULTISPECIES: ketoacyl-ACP synthase III [Limnospira]MDT9200340.1 ketoacyl-ACP synthase III [Limnospira sp. PMC 1042.18]ULB45959.1 ketoacyl-ACP synthase III [Limnospira fusiformis KN01]
MAYANFEGVNIIGLAAAVPERVIDNLLPTETFTVEDAAAVVQKTGIRFRRWAHDSICASDLCFAAADRLLFEMDIDRQTIDALIFVSQTPDYRMPATAILLQARLGLGTTTMAFDVNLGCSGYIQGLMLAYSLASNQSINRVLLLNGETRTRAYSFNDKATGLLFGDAGAATLIDRTATAKRSYFSMNSDGARGDLIMIKSGGYRFPSSAESFVQKRQIDGGFRSDEQGVIHGAGIFELVIGPVPRDINKILEKSNNDISDIDYFIFHQANRFMNEHLRKKMRIPAEKVPYSLDDFGNTSSVTIPITMVTRMGETLRAADNRCLLSGFGVGLSWGNAVLNIGPVTVCDLVEVGETL